MSQWLDLSNNSNRFKQSYFRNFVDVSGDVLIRNEQSLKLYNNVVPTQPQFSINSNELHIFKEDEAVYYDISNTTLIYLKDLTENVQDRFDYFNEKTKNIATDVSNSDTMVEFDALNNNVIIHSALDVSNDIIGLSDLSINRDIRIGGDASFNGDMNVGGEVSFKSNLYIVGDIAVQGRIYTTSNVVVSDAIRFDDDNFVLIVGSGQEVQLDIDNFALIKPTSDIGSTDIIFQDNFVLIQPNIEAYVYDKIHVTNGLTVASSATFTGPVFVETPLVENNAANKLYVDDTVKSASLAISLTTNGLTNSQIAVLYLSKIFPANEHNQNTICRVVCTDNGVITIRQFKLFSDIWIYQMNL